MKIITDFAVFDRELTAAEITNIYNGGKPKDESTKSGLFAYWRLEEGAGTTVEDRMLKLQGTIAGAAWSTDVP